MNRTGISKGECDKIISWIETNIPYLEDDERAEILKATFDFAKTLKPIYDKYTGELGS